ncbi:MAG TPA: glycosyltransferase [Thermoanaerobaculia bacterium]|nr:glycosyltransferase [Thermoanaerobaculia bacterium]
MAPPFAGHLNPLIAIGKRLAARGHELLYVTGPRKAALIERCGFAVDPVSKIDPGAMERIADTPYPVRGHPLRLARQLRANLALLPEIRRELEASFARRRPDLVIADFCAPLAGLVCDRLGIPWITTIPTPCALETRRGTPSYLGGWGPPRHFGHRLRDALGRAMTRGVKRTFEIAFAEAFRRAGTTVYRADGSEAAYSTAAILGLGMTELELDRDWPSAFSMIGPVTESPEPESLPLDLPEKPSRLVLVTLGTHLAWAKRDLVERVERLARAFPRYGFVISLGDLESGCRESGAPVREAGNVSVYPYVGYDRHLGRFAAVLHHGGAGITYSCIRAARPCLVWPRDYDQFDFAARIVHRGLGLTIRELGAPASARALDRVLYEFDPGPLAAMSAALERYDPWAACAAVIRRLMEEGRPGAGRKEPPETSGAPGAA